MNYDSFRPGCGVQILKSGGYLLELTTMVECARPSVRITYQGSPIRLRVRCEILHGVAIPHEWGDDVVVHASVHFVFARAEQREKVFMF